MNGKNTRTLDELGRIKLPAAFCSVLNWKEKDDIAVHLDMENQSVVLKKIPHRCALCNSMTDLTTECNGHRICKQCAQQIIEAQSSNS